MDQPPKEPPSPPLPRARVSEPPDGRALVEGPAQPAPVSSSSTGLPVIWGQIWSWVVVGAVASILLGFASQFMTSSHPYAADVFYVIAALLLIVKFVTWEDARQQSLRKRLALLIGGTVLTLVLLVGAIAWNHEMNFPSSPDVTICLMNPMHPSLLILNSSSQVAESVSYQSVFFDLDSSAPEIPLKVLSQSVGFVRAQANSGPYSFIEHVEGPLLMKQGDRIIGSVGISCPNCVSGKTYWVYLKFGVGGWYSQKQNDDSGNPYRVFPGANGIMHPVDLNKLIEKVPISMRVPVRDAPKSDDFSECLK